MTPERAEQAEQAERIRRARMASQAQPFISEWYEFEKGRVTAQFRTDETIIGCPVKAIEYQQYLRAIERVALACLNAQEAVKAEEE